MRERESSGWLERERERGRGVELREKVRGKIGRGKREG